VTSVSNLNSIRNHSVGESKVLVLSKAVSVPDPFTQIEKRYFPLGKSSLSKRIFCSLKHFSPVRASERFPSSSKEV